MWNPLDPFGPAQASIGQTIAARIEQLKAARLADRAESERLAREEREALARADEEQFASAIVAAFAAEGCPELADVPHVWGSAGEWERIPVREVEFSFPGHPPVYLFLANNAGRSGGSDWRPADEVTAQEWPRWMVRNDTAPSEWFDRLADALIAAELAPERATA